MDEKIDLVDLDDLSRDVPQEAFALLGNAVTAWSKVEAQLLELFALALNQPLPVAGITAGTMEPRALFDRTLLLLGFRAGSRKKPEMKKINARLSELQLRRNEIVHGELLGTHKKTGELLFIMRRYVPAETDEDTVIRLATYSTERLSWLVTACDRLVEELTRIYNELAEGSGDNTSDN